MPDNSRQQNENRTGALAELDQHEPEDAPGGKASLWQLISAPGSRRFSSEFCIHPELGKRFTTVFRSHIRQDHLVYMARGLMRSDLITDGFVSRPPPAIHFRQQRNFEVHVVVGDHPFLEAFSRCSRPAYWVKVPRHEIGNVRKTVSSRSSSHPSPR